MNSNRQNFFRDLICTLTMSLLLTIFMLGTGHADIVLDAATQFTAGPASPQNGFALYVQDSNGLALELCLDSVDGQGTPPPCFFDPPEIGNPFSEQIGFGAEGFWWAADATIDVPETGLSAILIQAAEAAFLTEVPIDGEQFPFTRMRIRVDVPQPGFYTVTHPYGQESYLIDAVEAGHEIRDSYDIEFSLDSINQGRVGPWLQWDNSLPAPPLGYIGDAANPHTVTGSPLGTNFFQVEGVDLDGNPIDLDGFGNNLVRTDEFIVMGKLFTGVAPTPLIVTRTSYERDFSGQVNVFATSAPTASLSFVGGANLPPAQIPLTGDGNGLFFAHIPLTDASTLPMVVDVTATNPGNSETLVKHILTDFVTITMAEYDITNGLLRVEATSGDLFAPPVLTTNNYGSLPISVFTSTPPASIRVSSTAGGSDSRPVRIIADAAPNNLPPQAIDDTATTDEGIQVTVNLLANDFDPNDEPDTFPPLGSIDPTTLTIGTSPGNGTLLNNGDGSVTYTPLGTFNGIDQFTYTVRDQEGAFSNIATVRITVLGVNNPPVAVDDLAAVNIGNSLDINVLINDTDADNNIDPASITIISLPTLGTALPQANGTIAYTAGSIAGSDNFSYSISDTNGAVSNIAIVSVTISDVQAEAIQVTRALFKTRSNQWRVDGTSTIPGPGNFINVHLGPNLLGTLLGTVEVGVDGAWSFRERDSSILPNGITEVTVQSTGGTSVTTSLRVR